MKKYYSSILTIVLFITLISWSQSSYSQQPDIDWEVLSRYFVISNIKIGKQQLQNSVGKINEFNVLSFVVEAKTTFMITIVFAHYYDSDGIETDSPTLVEFKPDYLGDWQQGNRSRATVILPDDLSVVKIIKFKQL